MKWRRFCWRFWWDLGVEATVAICLALITWAFWTLVFALKGFLAPNQP